MTYTFVLAGGAKVTFFFRFLGILLNVLFFLGSNVRLLFSFSVLNRMVRFVYIELNCILGLLVVDTQRGNIVCTMLLHNVSLE